MTIFEAVVAVILAGSTLMNYWMFRKMVVVELRVAGIIKANFNHSESILNIWKYLMARAEAEILRAGLGTKNSPLAIDLEKARPFYSRFFDRLIEFYRKHRDLPEEKLFEKIALDFKEDLVKDVCGPMGLDNGACVLIALELAKKEAAEKS